MTLTVIGCSGSFAGPSSPASCYLLQAEHDGRTWSVVMDLGSGSLGALQRHTDVTELDAVLLSHLHPDHCMDMTGLYVASRWHPSAPRTHRLPVHAPAGARVRLEGSYEGIVNEAPAGVSAMEQVFDFTDLHDRDVLSIGPFSITVFEVAHPVQAFGFRVQVGEQILAYTGDTDSCAALAPLMTGADLVLADSAFVDGRDAQPGVHLSGRRAAQAALEAGGVGRLMLTHFPAWNDPQVSIDAAARVWRGDSRVVEVAEAGRSYRVARRAQRSS